MSDVPTTKACTKCGVEKGLEEFYDDKGSRSGKTGNCKQCIRVSSAANYFANREDRLEKYKLYREKHKDALAVQKKDWHTRNRGEVLAKKRLYYQEHKETILSKDKGERIVDPVKFMVRNAKKRAADRGRPFSITKDDVSVPIECPVIPGIALSVGDGTHHHGSPTIDEMTIPHGYQPWNQKVISHRANALKSDATPVESARIALYQAECQQNYIGHLEAELSALKSELHRLKNAG
jgi:hypothetical protein